ncbi:hypothetical protein B0H17DRAFT_1146619 [Mycena rosella]|uniref:Uncharacterized protein n=1 Tax=Mycena rosella TaxID=1033263 RepID=A0AAD7G4B3_MYCRO|nr:hypothetical protein B0H17DRAFT_1146619 [Mycena rosella]
MADGKNELQSLAYETRTETVILIDEGQATYTDLILWNTYFKIWAGHIPGPFSVIIACAHASPRTITSGPYPQIVLEERQKIGLHPQEGPTDTPLGLLFDKMELDELYALAVAAKAMPLIDEPLKESIFQWTEGYIAVVCAITKMIGESTMVADGQRRGFLPNGSIKYELGDQLPGGLDVEDIDFAHEKGLLYTERTPIYSRSRRVTFAFPLQRALLQICLCPPMSDLLKE